MAERFAIYFAPSATSNLWERAATWLGRDAADGNLFSGPVAGIDRDRLLNLTQSANRYGFHATLKAPMALAEGKSETDLRSTLEDFAAHVVEDFDPFRAPMSPKDRAARASGGLTERQIELLDGYGYPYVFEQFRFHMTLTDRLSEADTAEIAAAAHTWFDPVLEDNVVLDRLALFHEHESGKPFRRVVDFKLGSAA